MEIIFSIVSFLFGGCLGSFLVSLYFFKRSLPYELNKQGKEFKEMYITLYGTLYSDDGSIITLSYEDTLRYNASKTTEEEKKEILRRYINEK